MEKTFGPLKKQTNKQTGEQSRETVTYTVVLPPPPKKKKILLRGALEATLHLGLHLVSASHLTLLLKVLERGPGLAHVPCSHLD